MDVVSAAVVVLVVDAVVIVACFRSDLAVVAVSVVPSVVHIAVVVVAVLTGGLVRWLFCSPPNSP